MSLSRHDPASEAGDSPDRASAATGRSSSDNSASPTKNGASPKDDPVQNGNRNRKTSGKPKHASSSGNGEASRERRSSRAKRSGAVGDELSLFADRRYAQFVGPWTPREVETVYAAIQAVEWERDRDASPADSEVLVANNPRRLRRRWLCAAYRLSVTPDYFAALRYDRDKALVAHEAPALADRVREA